MSEFAKNGEAIDKAIESLGDTRGSGSPKAYFPAMLEAAKRDTELAREFIMEQGMEPFAQSLVAGLSNHKACYTCGCPGRHVAEQRLFAQIAKLVGVAPQVMVAIQQIIGVEPNRAKRAVEMVQRVEAMDPREQALESAEVVRRWNAENPADRIAV